MPKDFDAYYARSSQPRRLARDDAAESARLYDLLEAYAGGLPALRRRYVDMLSLPWLFVKSERRETMTPLERSTLQAVLGVGQGYLEGRTDMFGTTFGERPHPALPPLFVRGDRTSGRKIARLLGGDATALLKLTGPLLADEGEAREVFAGKRALGFVPFYMALATCVKNGHNVPSISRLLGIPVAADAVWPRLPASSVHVFRTRGPAATPLWRDPRPKRDVKADLKAAPVATPEPELPEPVPHDEVGLLEPPRQLDAMDALAQVLLDSREARHSFGLYVQGKLGKRNMAWSHAAGLLGYSSRGQFIKLLHGEGQWRLPALLELPQVLGEDATAFAQASGLLTAA